jgi:hypothetical protein
MIKPCPPHSNGRCLKQPPSILRQTTKQHMAFSQTCLKMLALTAVTAAWSPAIRSMTVQGGTTETCSFRCPHRKNPATKEAMQSALDIQSMFLDMSWSTTARHLPHSMLELRHVETTTSASQLQAHLQAALIIRFPENDNIIEKPASQVADRGPQQCPQQFQQKCWCWSRLHTHIHG